MQDSVAACADVPQHVLHWIRGLCFISFVQSLPLTGTQWSFITAGHHCLSHMRVSDCHQFLKEHSGRTRNKDKGSGTRFYWIQDESVCSVMYSLQELRLGALHDWPAAGGEDFSTEGSRSLPSFCGESHVAADTDKCVHFHWQHFALTHSDLSCIHSMPPAVFNPWQH